MSPLGMYLIYCDHGFPVGDDCWRCWQRRALEAEADVRALYEDLMSAKAQWGDNYRWTKFALDFALSRPGVKRIMEQP